MIIIDSEIKNSDKAIGEKLAENLGKIDERATEDTQKLEKYYNEVTEDINKNKAELEELYKKVSDKEKDIKTSLGIVDEYKEGLDKLKSEIQDMDSQLTAKREEAEKLAAAAAASAAVAATAQAEAPAETPSSEAETEILKGPVEFVN